MAVIEVLPSGQKFGTVGVAIRLGQVASIKQAVSDGDTVSTAPHGNLSLRFLGVDAPETKYPLGGQRAFIALDDEKWVQHLDDLRTGGLLQPFDPPMTPELRAHLLAKVNGQAATNHRRHALEAEEALAAAIDADVEALRTALNVTAVQAREQFRFHLAFANDVMDGFGRLLCYINRKEEDAAKRPDFLQERMLREGTVLPFFVWPNVDPFIKIVRVTGTLRDAVPTPAKVADLTDPTNPAAKSLKKARDYTIEARTANPPRGVHSTADPLALEPFEIRFLARGRLTRRWVIDLSADNPLHPRFGQILEPQAYFLMNPEDRLFVPDEFVPLFTDGAVGWQTQTVAAAVAAAGV